MDFNQSLRGAAWRAHSEGRLDEAEKGYRLLLGKAPQADDASNLGALLRAGGRLGEASAHYIYWLGIFKEDKQLLMNALNAWRDLGDNEQCETSIQAFLERNGYDRDLVLSLARTHIDSSQYEKGIKILKAEGKKESLDAGALIDMGRGLTIQGDLGEAEECFQRAALVEEQSKVAVSNLVSIKCKRGDFKNAVRIFRENKVGNDIPAELAASGASALMGNGEFEEAILLLRDLCYKYPSKSDYWLNLAACLKSIKNTIRCHNTLKTAQLWCPHSVLVRHAVAQSYCELGISGKAGDVLMHTILEEEFIRDEFLYNVQFLGSGYGIVGKEDLRNLVSRWEKEKTKTFQGAIWADHMRDKKNILKIGYLSGDFNSHPVGRFMLPIIEAHDRDRVHITCISSTTRRDGVTQDIIGATDEWLEISQLNDAEAARVVSDAEIDILVELGGYTSGSRLGVLMTRPAIKQLSYLGYFAPTYLSCIDGWIGDEALFSTLDEADIADKNLRMIDGGYMVYNAVTLPEVRRVRGSEFRFGSFNHSRKITRDTLNLWSEVLKKCHESVIVLKSISFVEPEEEVRIRKLFEGNGIDGDRIRTIPWVKGWQSHVEKYNEIDVSLDCIPYGGATTSCEALSMGVPVITLKGSGMVGMLTASINISAGRECDIADDWDKFIEKAVAYYRNGIRINEEREALRTSWRRSKLHDAKRVASGLERIYLDELVTC